MTTIKRHVILLTSSSIEKKKMEVKVIQHGDDVLVKVYSGRGMIFSRNYWDTSTDEVWQIILVDFGGEADWLEAMLEG